MPQNRERIFAVSIRKDVDDDTFRFPEEITLTTRLKNILERNVDEKYYIDNERTRAILNSEEFKEKIRNRSKSDDTPVRITNMYGEQFGTGYAGNIWDTDGLSPTLQTAQGGNRMPLVVDEEPIIVASRGRNPNNPSDRTTGAPTEQRLEPNLNGTTNTITTVAKDNYVLEPQVLRAERTEYGKAIRKQYELGEIKEKIGNMREMRPRTDGIANTITTVQKDNYVVEPIVYDDYNSRFSSEQEVINTLTTNCGASAMRNGVKICEPIVCEERRDEGIRFFKDDCCGTLRTIDACGDKRVLEPMGNYNNIPYRIRKLTPTECWRLMGFSDYDCIRAGEYVSASALYKQAGNSIVTNCLVAIFYSLLLKDNGDEYIEHLVDFNQDS